MQYFAAFGRVLTAILVSFWLYFLSRRKLAYVDVLERRRIVQLAVSSYLEALLAAFGRFLFFFCRFLALFLDL